MQINIIVFIFILILHQIHLILFSIIQIVRQDLYGTTNKTESSVLQDDEMEELNEPIPNKYLI
jgi:hypothetical protein